MARQARHGRDGQAGRDTAGNTKRGTLPRFAGGTMEDKDKPKREFSDEQKRVFAQIVRVILTPDPPKVEQAMPTTP